MPLLPRTAASSFPRLGARDILAATVLVAVIFGLGEASVTWIRAWIMHEPTDQFTGITAAWTAPLAAAALLLPVAIAMVIGDRLVPRLQLRRGIVPLVAFVAAYSLIVGSRAGVGAWSARILAAGIATLLVRSLTRDGLRLRFPLQRMATAAVAMLMAVATLAPARQAAGALAQRLARDEARAGSPNVLVLIWDTARAANLSPWGGPADLTPTLASLASRGLTYERAFAPASWSLPSHASLFTGRWPHELGTRWRVPLEGDVPTIAEAMRARGFSTASVTGNIFYGRSTYGLDRGFQYYDDEPALGISSIGNSWYVGRRVLERVRDRFGDAHQYLVRRPAAEINRSFLDWVDGLPARRPFFAVLNQFDAHEPYLPPAPFASQVRSSGSRYWFDEDAEITTRQTQQELEAAYNECLRYLDVQLARLLGDLDRRRLRDNTIIVVTSDHGEELGDRGSMVVGHGRNMNTPVLQIPMLIVDPRRTDHGTRVAATVSLRDLPATILDLVEPGTAAGFPGQSLVAVAEGRVAPEPRYAMLERHLWIRNNPAVPSSFGDMFSVIDGPAHYIVDGRRREWLYDLSEDPWERRNLRAQQTPAVRMTLGAARAQVAVAGAPVPRPAGQVTAAGEVALAPALPNVGGTGRP